MKSIFINHVTCRAYEVISKRRGSLRLLLRMPKQSKNGLKIATLASDSIVYVSV